MEFFDSHSHYNDEKYDVDRKELIESIYNEGITKTVCVGYNVEKSRNALEIAKENHFMFATCGISPNDIEEYVENSLEEIEKIAKNDKIVAIGEIGLVVRRSRDGDTEGVLIFQLLGGIAPEVALMQGNESVTAADLVLTQGDLAEHLAVLRLPPKCHQTDAPLIPRHKDRGG